MAEKMVVTEISKVRLEDYLTTIYRFEEALGIVRTTDISRELGVSPATVSKIIKKLEDKNLVKRVKYKYVQLTDEGKRIAEQIIRKHRIAEAFLYTVLGFNELDSHRYAHHLEHLPDVIIERIFDVIGRPSRCPHGNIIPGGETIDEALVSLDNIENSKICTIKRIAGELINVLEHLYKLGVTINSTIIVIEHTDRSVIIELINGLRVEIPNYFARFVFAKC